MRMLFALLLLLGSWLSATGAPAITVQNAIKLLSKDQARNIVRIEARDGTPAPERWYFQIYDPASENGLREIVVWQKTIVASRTLSQFLDGAKPEDVVGAKLVRIDSDDLIKIAQEYVEANSLDVTRINYTMFKDATSTSPVWKLSCLDDSGRKLAEIVINARNASVVSHDGFELSPGETVRPAIPVAPAASPQPAKPDVKTPDTVAAADTSPSPSPVASSAPSPRLNPSPGASASPTTTPKRGLFQKIFGGGRPTPTPTPRIH